MATNDPLDFYLAVLYPVLIGKSDSAVMAVKGTKVYTQNSGLDRNKDGKITKGDIRNYFGSTVNAYAASNNIEMEVNFEASTIIRPLNSILIMAAIATYFYLC
jgi:hypothetical protein